MRDNLTETHIAGIAAAVLAIIIIVVAVVLMSVAKPPGERGGTFSPTSAGIQTTTDNAIPVHTPPEETATPTPTPTPTPEPDVNAEINPQHVSVKQTNDCTDDSSTAKFTITNSNTAPVTITYTLLSSNADPTEITVAGSTSKTITVEPASRSDELTVVIPGTDSQPRTLSMPKACNAGPPASIAFSDQTTNGSVIQFENVVLPQGGFFILEGGDDRIQSNYVEPTDGGSLTLRMGEAPLEETTTLTVTLYQDTNGNGAFDPNVDAPYETDGSPVSATATVTVEGTTPTKTPAQ